MRKLAKVKYQKIFFSPHFDDAVLSCGGMIGSDKKALVVTVFSSHGEGKKSRYAKRYLQYCGFKDSKEYFDSRKREEKKAAKILKYKTLWLGFPEAIFRFQERHFFPRFFYNNKKRLLEKVDEEDKKIIEPVRQKIEKIINHHSNKNSQFYFPLGIGGHVDHQLLYQIGTEMNKKRIFFYEDFPYNLRIDRKKIEKFLSQKGLQIKKFRLKERFIRQKFRAILTYSSQIKPLFGTEKKLRELFLRFHKEPYENYWYFN